MTSSKTLIEKIDQWKKSSPAATALSNLCEEHLIPAYYFGGVCRSCWKNQKPRDIDLVVDDLRWEKFQSLIKNPVRKNRFGGLKFELCGTEIDAWAISRTWAFANGLSYPESPTILPETTFLNVESVVALIWHPETPWVFEKNFFEAMESNTLEIQNPNTPDPALCIARARKFITQGWLAGKSVRDFETYHKTHGITETQIAEATAKHYPKITTPRSLSASGL